MPRLSLSILPFLFLMNFGAQAVTVPDTSNDPYLWLEDVHGAKPLAWVAEQNKKSLAVLKADPRYQKNYDSVLQVLDAPDRIPSGSLDHGFVYNFWQDAKNPKGVWRRTSIADYAHPAPHWEVILDVDALAKAEKENWVFEGASISPNQKRALIRLSRGGGDAVVVREFDMGGKSFDAEGFFLKEAKSDASWWGDDRILFDTDFGKGSLTNSGYPRIVKLWKRGEDIAKARTLFEGEVKDVASQAAIFDGKKTSEALVVRAVSFFE